jgi:hypothetical protein
VGEINMIKDADKFLDSFISVIIASIPIFLVAVSFWAKGFDIVIDGTVHNYYLTPSGARNFTTQILFSVFSLFAGLFSRLFGDGQLKELTLYASIILYMVSIGFFLLWVSSIFSFA